MNTKEEEFKALVKAAHDAIDDYSEARLADSGRDWFAEGLDGKIQKVVHRLLAFGIGDTLATSSREGQSGEGN